MSKPKTKKRQRKKGLSLQSKIAKQVTAVKKEPPGKVFSRPGGRAVRTKIIPAAILSQSRSLPKKQALHELQNLLVDKTSRDKAIECRFPQNFQIKSNLRYRESEHGVGFDLAFEARILQEFSNEISEFLRLKDDFDSCILLSKLDEAEETLLKIKDAYGYSNWYFSSRLNLFYERNEHKKVTDYRNEVFERFKKEDFNSLSEVYVNYPFIRCDKGVSFDRYAFSIEHQSEELSLENDLSSVEVVHFSHFYSPSHVYKKYSTLISENSSNNIIDRYLGFKRILYSCVLHGEEVSECILYIDSLANEIKDKSFFNIYSFMSDCRIEHDLLDSMLIDICDLYVEGKYKEVVEKSEILLNLKPTFTSVNEIYIKSLIRCGQRSKIGSLLGTICNSIIDLYTSSDKRKIITDLKKYYLRFYHCDWSYFIKLQFNKFSTHKNENNIEFLYKFLDINCSLANPFSTIRAKDSNELENRSVSMNLLSSSPEVVKSLTSVDKNRKLKILGDYYFTKEDYRKSEENYLTLSKCNDFLFSEHAKSQLVSCYFKTKDFGKAIHELAILIIEGKGQNLLPLNEIYSYIYKENKKELRVKELYERAIIAHQYFTVYNSEDGEIVSLLCEDILEKEQIYTQVDLNILNDKLYIYFFRNVLTPEFLEKIDIFSSVEDVYIFRFFVLKNLISITQDTTLNSEMFNNIEQFVKETCVCEVGLGRIEVDVLSIRNELSESLLEAFEEIKNSDKNPFLESDYMEVTGEKGTYTVSSNKFFVDVLDLYYQIRDVFTLSPSHGLDYFLNMNIRHGGIVNLLWGPAKSHKICYQKNDKGYFEKERYWFDQNPYITAEAREFLDSSLRKFSKQLDFEIQKIKSYIHINTGEFQDEGKAFNYFTDQDFVEGIARSINSESTIDEFLDVVLKDLISVTEHSLCELITHIDVELRGNINSVFDSLKDQFESIGYKFDELMRKIKLAQREVNEKIDELITWMSWKNETKQSFMFGSAIASAKEMLSSLHPNRKIDIEYLDEYQRLIKGEFFRKFTMVFLILFENVVVHSSEENDIAITIEIKRVDGQILILVSNFFEEKVSLELKNKIDSLNGKINDSFISEANRESGSGLFKIKKVITKDMKIANFLSLSLDSNIFSVHLYLDEGDVNETHT
ncbi:GHKL domain-containing protein [Corallincola luteus]|uniref:GHKL domain-containing protein n=1 Tax=Corallincola luteus TaxID=1775177 RepID=A0ABY2ANZ4_9GAMM|nr:GHKL domain-containing protein [Corallincola luteus]TCI04923.1 GHKL domain-containing protein [Corallincola luteus]